MKLKKKKSIQYDNVEEDYGTDLDSEEEREL